MRWVRFDSQRCAGHVWGALGADVVWAGGEISMCYLPQHASMSTWQVPQSREFRTKSCLCAGHEWEGPRADVVGGLA